jgi:hypothetical protein
MSRAYWFVKSEATILEQNLCEKRASHFPTRNTERKTSPERSDRFAGKHLHHLHRSKERLTKCASGGHQKKRTREKRTTKAVQTLYDYRCAALAAFTFLQY